MKRYRVVLRMGSVVRTYEVEAPSPEKAGPVAALLGWLADPEAPEVDPDGEGLETVSVTQV